MEISREVTLDATADEVWALLTDPDELAAWVGEEVRAADVAIGTAGLAWTWSPDGVSSSVELTVVETDDGTTVRVTERRTGAIAGARACSVGDAWDDRLLGLELRCLRRCLIPA